MLKLQPTTAGKDNREEEEEEDDSPGIFLARGGKGAANVDAACRIGPKLAKLGIFF
jgi:hypothetical protein